MCKHYREDETMEEYALRTVPWLRIPAAYAGVETDGYPGRKKRLVRRWRAENELVVMRWGLWPFYAKTGTKVC